MKKHLPSLLLLACAVGLLLGLAHLVQIRFAQGDVYPAYSSLRADPLGTMALYESLEKIPGLSVRRDISDANRLPEAPRTVYLHLAGSRYEWEWLSQSQAQEIRQYLARGNRLVITYFPQTESVVRYRFDDDDDETNSVPPVGPKEETKKSEPPAKKKKSPKKLETSVSLETEWGFHPHFEPLATDGETYTPAQVKNLTDLPLPPTLAWHSGLVFTNCAAAWQTIYARGDQAVVMERNVGGGTVVLATDSFFTSNEAMLGDRHADLLAWLIGPHQNIVFDEAHLGVVETQGVTTLMRKYRLHGFMGGLLLLAGLFIWKNATSLALPPAAEQPATFVTGKDSASGFINLLRRSIAPRDLLAICFAEWKKSVASSGKCSTARQQQAEAIFQADQASPETAKNPLETYRKISTALGSHNHKL